MTRDLGGTGAWPDSQTLILRGVASFHLPPDGVLSFLCTRKEKSGEQGPWNSSTGVPELTSKGQKQHMVEPFLGFTGPLEKRQMPRMAAGLS